MPISQCHCAWRKEVCEICLVGKSLWVSLPLFWIRACSQDIFKTIKGTNSSTETAEHSPSDISRRYSSDGKNRRIFNEPRHIDFSTSTSGFCHKAEKISSETITTNRLFRSKNRYPHHDFGTNRGKDEMPESSFSLSNHRFGINRIDKSDLLNCPSSSACSSTARVLTTTTNTITKPSLFISKQELLWWVKNLRLNNGRSLRQKEPNLVIQTDASKSGWGPFGVSTGGKWSEK